MALPVLPAEVQSLLRTQVQAGPGAALPAPGARRPSLATVYVRQELGSAVEDPQPEPSRPDPVWDGRAPLRLPAAPTVRLDLLLSRRSRTVSAPSTARCCVGRSSRLCWPSGLRAAAGCCWLTDSMRTRSVISPRIGSLRRAGTLPTGSCGRPARHLDELVRVPLLATIAAIIVEQHHDRPLPDNQYELRFLHHSLADHLAATAKARLLPTAFDPEHDAFVHLLHAGCQGVRGRHARSVVDAAAALAELSPRFVAEAARALEGLSVGGAEPRFVRWWNWRDWTGDGGTEHATTQGAQLPTARWRSVCDIAQPR